MATEPVLAIAVSARDWPDRLRQSLADHGGARVRLTALSAHDLDDEHHDVLLIDDICSFLARGLVAREQARGRAVIGVFDPTEPAGEAHLRELGVDGVIACSESAEVFVATAGSLAQPAPSGRVAPPTAPSVPMEELGAVVDVCGISGGVGASEVALALACALDRSTLVELATPVSLAQRTGLDLHPNFATAVEIVDHGSGDLEVALQRVDGHTAVLVGVGEGTSGPRGATRRVIDAVRRRIPWTVLDRGATAAFTSADQTVFVTVATPVGIARCVDGLRGSDLTRVHIVLNRAPQGGYARSELLRSVLGELRPRSVTIVPEDPNVAAAAWNGRTVRTGPFSKAMVGLAASIGGAG